MRYGGVVLKRGSSGQEVKFIKDCLYSLGYLNIKPRKQTFGSDTEVAVKKYQKAKNLMVDGKVGPLTWDAIMKDMKHKPVEDETEQNKPNNNNGLLRYTDFPHITAPNLRLINEDIKKVSSKRYTFIKFILGFAYDVDYVKDNIPTALYVYGANLVDTNLNIQKASKPGFIEEKYKRNPKYFSDGRLEWLKQMAERYPNLAASDCSGMIVGFLRMFNYVSNKWDATANALCSNEYSTATTRSKLTPGDFVGFNGHIGVYVGGGLVVEFAGACYGCQLTSLKQRRVKDLMHEGIIIPTTQWSKFRIPKWF